MSDLFELFEELENQEEQEKSEIVHAPFAYVGGKSRSVDHILPLLPMRKIYVEPFGGSGAVLLARRKSRLEVFNDRYAGVVAFYRCLRDPAMLQELCEKMKLSIHSREEFAWCKETWENVDDPVERAFRWIYMMSNSFGSLGRNWGRSLDGSNCMGRKFLNKIPKLQKVHERLKHVQIENRDWHKCVKEYDSPDTVFYLDPPYFDADQGGYKHKFGVEDHRALINLVQDLDGFVAISGYANPLYDKYSWDDRCTWESFMSVAPTRNEGDNKKTNLIGKRGRHEEVLWIKE